MSRGSRREIPETDGARLAPLEGRRTELGKRGEEGRARRGGAKYEEEEAMMMVVVAASIAACFRIKRGSGDKTGASYSQSDC